MLNVIIQVDKKILFNINITSKFKSTIALTYHFIGDEATLSEFPQYAAEENQTHGEERYGIGDG